MTAVAIVAGAAAARARLEAAVAGASGLRLTATGSSAEAIAADPRLAATEVLLLYASAPDLVARELGALPPIPVVAFVRTPIGRDAARTLLAAGVRGVLPDDAAADEIAAAVEAAAAGLVAVPFDQMGDLADPRPAAAPRGFVDVARRSATDSVSLTPRESEIVAMLAEGLPNKLIASRLGISDHTVKTHLEAIFDKLGASNRADAVARAVRAGLLLL